MELSLCMIVKNEESSLDACLQSVKDAVDEIIILDTGSQDRTKEIAARYTPHVYDWTWQDDFAAARNASFARATKPYILWLDADDVLDAGECKKLIALKETLDGSVDAVMMPYQYAFSEDGKPTLVFDRERIVRREAGFAFEGAVHEAMRVSGYVIRADIAVRHTGRHAPGSNKRNLAIYESMLARGQELRGRDLYYYARELKSAGEYARAAQAFERFLAEDGWIENRIDACVLRGECLMETGRPEEAKRSLLGAVALGGPRAQTLCALGACCMGAGELHDAALWYRAALLARPPEDTRAFDSPDAYGYIPLMQLCVILWRLGDEAQAAAVNEQALLLRPGDTAALKNRAFFRERLSAADRQEKTGWGE